MNTTPPPKKHRPKLSSAEAQARLADALRENLRRRKAQIRARDGKDTAVDKSAVDKSEADDEGKTS
ncbi:MAG: hypothetical protein K2P94_08980 [Rhodospirillaceae bacterium]|nr:hypothetical protein [Rhodospirillaceae bacterium]